MSTHNGRLALCSICIISQLIGNGLIDELEAAMSAQFQESTGRSITTEEAILIRRDLYAIRRTALFPIFRPRRTNYALQRHATLHTRGSRPRTSEDPYEEI